MNGGTVALLDENTVTLLGGNDMMDRTTGWERGGWGWSSGNEHDGNASKKVDDIGGTSWCARGGTWYASNYENKSAAEVTQ